MLNQKNFTKRIWILWYQGILAAPFVVKKCINSWVQKNPEWEVIVLDESNLEQYITLDLPQHKLNKISLTKQSNLVRLQLLAQHGGVWTDATTLCTTPLDNWLFECCQSGFFAFSNAGKDREMSNWFMVSEKNNPIVEKMRIKYCTFFAQNSFQVGTPFKKRIIKVLSKYFNQNRHRTRFWLSPLVTKVLKVHPYFIFHYIFYQLITTDKQCEIIWQNTKKISPINARLIQTIGLHTALTPKIKASIDSPSSPLYKLTWKYDHEKEYSNNSVLSYILEGQHDKQL